MDPDKIIREFCDAWERGDVDTIVDAFTEDAVYHNIPMAPCEGKEAIGAFVSVFFESMSKSTRFEILKQVTAGNCVMNERIDHLELASGKVALPVCGVFELTSDGKISGWRDYFDMGQFTGQ